MSVAAFVVIAGAFLVGVTGARHVVSPAAQVVPGQLSSWVVAILVGASAGVVVDHVWVGVRSLTTSNQLGVPSAINETIITSELQAVLLEGGALLALAAIVYLLAPQHERRVETEAGGPGTSLPRT